MMHNFYQMAVRLLLKRRLFSIINISGLALGMTAFALIMLFVLHEHSYDDFHAKGDRIFRLKNNFYTNGVLDAEGAGVGAAVGPDLKDMLPEVKSYVRLRRNQVMLSYNDIVFRENGVFFASEDFFRMFSIPLVRGVDSLVLREPWKMAVSESFARKYFGDEDPIGKVMTNIGRDRYEVTGVFKDIPENSHLRIDAVFSFSSLELIFGKDKDPYLTDWRWIGYQTYIELDPSADPGIFQSKLEGAVETRMGEALKKAGQWISFDLQPVSSIHLRSQLSGEIAPNGDEGTVSMSVLVATLILVIAWINYINLATARSLERAKEVGIRKALGSSRAQLVRQFLAESFLLNFIAFVLTVGLVVLLLPQFSLLVDRTLSLTELTGPGRWIFVGVLFVAGVLCSGLYPAFVMSSFAPAKVLKGSFKPTGGRNFLQKGLVVVQFAASVTLITGTLVIYQQTNLMRKTPVGVDLEQVLVVEGPIVTDSLYDSRFQALKNEVGMYPGFQAVSASSAVPGRSPRSGSDIRLERQQPAEGRSFSVVFVDYDFVNTFNLSITAGRDFSRKYNDATSVLLNEAGMKVLGITDAQKVIGEKVLVYGEPLTVVGVLKDYHYESMRDQIAPAVFWCETRVADFYSFRIQNPESMSSLVKLVEENFKEQFPGNQFIYTFLDDLYSQQYHSEQQFAKTFGVFTVVAILIACLGLYGLSSYVVVLRSKEIGIRKVFGASVRQVTVMISREFIFIVLLSNAIAWPIGWTVMDNWLSGYATRIDLGIMFFLVPAVIAVIIAVLTVGSQSIKAARANPINVIRES